MIHQLREVLLNLILLVSQLLISYGTNTDSADGFTNEIHLKHKSVAG